MALTASGCVGQLGDPPVGDTPSYGDTVGGSDDANSDTASGGDDWQGGLGGGQTSSGGASGGSGGSDAGPNGGASAGGSASSGGGEPPATNADFCESSQQIVFEAESYWDNNGYAQVASAEASGGAVMQVGSSGNIDYSLNIATAGTAYVWIRTHASNSEDNGLHLYLDGQQLEAPASHPQAGTGDIYLKKIGWSWEPEWQGSTGHSGPITFQAAAGDHTLSIHKRKIERPWIDKVVINFSGAPPDGLGPAETPCP